jgi:hypothetical protein
MWRTWLGFCAGFSIILAMDLANYLMLMKGWIPAAPGSDPLQHSWWVQLPLTVVVALPVGGLGALVGYYRTRKLESLKETAAMEASLKDAPERQKLIRRVDWDE